ncbi:MAG: hypothetical protein HY850_13010 [Betaproteobacteria bacterium]|nr:hypothetical protein [Betaproteobacteria bacterium]
MEAISSLAQSQAQTAAQASTIALQSAAQAEQRTAQVVAQQSQQVQPSNQSGSSNPDYLGNSVDTYA